MARGFFLIVLFALTALPAVAGERVIFATDWKAQAEHGGFYQAVAKGFYEARGLDVEIRQGGPGVNIPQLMGAGAIDFGMGSSSFMPLNMLREGIKTKAVMAVFQKSPEILMTHPRDDIHSLADMKGRPILLADASIGAVFVWLKARYGFEDAQVRKYTFNMAPFLANSTAIQQGYLTSEPFMYERETGEKPKIYLYADNGYPSYANLVMVNTQVIERKPEIVQAFVDATIEGWRDYLHGDPTPGNALIQRDNPEMSAAIIAQAIEKMNTYGIVESGDTQTFGIGAMSAARWSEFFNVMRESGIYPPDMDVHGAYTLQFIGAKPE
ncbi:MAG: ABC transporter substrate-binding protein [Alphaproteobacteria bacterium]|nr:ABC transporter substrate-binding protein [Alphaproteobacteria bacterium]